MWGSCGPLGRGPSGPPGGGPSWPSRGGGDQGGDVGRGQKELQVILEVEILQMTLILEMLMMMTHIQIEVKVQCLLEKVTEHKGI